MDNPILFLVDDEPEVLASLTAALDSRRELGVRGGHLASFH
jgi:hypothetical protein